MVIGNVKFMGELLWVFLRLPRGARGHDELDSLFLEASDQFEE